LMPTFRIWSAARLDALSASKSCGRIRIKLEVVLRSALFFVWLLPLLAQARELVCLKTGFCMEAASHMISDGMLVIQSGSGTLQFPVDQVDAIRALPALAMNAVLAPLPKLANTADTASEELLIWAALREGLQPEFVRSVAMVESGLRQTAVSPKGATGLMQLMPFTADKLGVDPNMADQNALGGAAFLRQLLIRYNGNSALALAAYNAGPGAVAKYKGVPPYLETRRYIVKVLREYARQQRLTEQTIRAAKNHPAVLPGSAAMPPEKATAIADQSVGRP
jgi:hypothetical protein